MRILDKQTGKIYHIRCSKKERLAIRKENNITRKLQKYEEKQRFRDDNEILAAEGRL